jgi:hypothetical protein
MCRVWLVAWLVLARGLLISAVALCQHTPSSLSKATSTAFSSRAFGRQRSSEVSASYGSLTLPARAAHDLIFASPIARERLHARAVYDAHTPPANTYSSPCPLSSTANTPCHRTFIPHNALSTMRNILHPPPAPPAFGEDDIVPETRAPYVPLTLAHSPLTLSILARHTQHILKAHLQLALAFP